MQRSYYSSCRWEFNNCADTVSHFTCENNINHLVSLLLCHLPLCNCLCKVNKYECTMCCVQSKLYPTIGLQTPGEIVEANFGQRPFVYDIENYIQVFAIYSSWYDARLINFN